MKLYVLQEDWAHLDGCGYHVLGLYTDEKQAKKALKQAVRQARKDGLVFDTININDDDYYESYDEGWYNSAHYRAQIEYLTVHERRNKK